MAKWYGIIGYAHSVEKKPGVWADEITDRNYAGDVIRNTSRWSTSADMMT